MRLRIEVAKHAGYCYGVERALGLATSAAESSPRPVQTLGPIIHNPQVVDWLVAQGVKPVRMLDEAKSGTILIRTHGVDPKTVREAKRRGLIVVDATCPFVAKAQRRAAALRREGYRVVIVGERDHPEVAALLAYVENEATVAEGPEDLDAAPRFGGRERVGVVVQTTQSIENLRRVVDRLLGRVSELKVYNTICNATVQRQAAARELAARANVMLVVGGKNSANTTRLAQICMEMNPRTHHIETAEEIDNAWFSGGELDGLIGVTAGASTPDWILREVVEQLEALGG